MRTTYVITLKENEVRRAMREAGRRGISFVDQLFPQLILERLDAIAAENQARGRAKFNQPIFNPPQAAVRGVR